MTDDFCPNEHLAGLKAEAEEEYMEARVVNIYVHPFIEFGDSIFVSFSNAEEYYLESDTEPSGLNFVYYVEVSVPSRKDNIFIGYEYITLMPIKYINNFEFENSVLNNNISFCAFNTDIKFENNKVHLDGENDPLEFNKNVLNFHRDKTRISDDYVPINKYFNNKHTDINDIFSKEIIEKKDDNLEWLDLRIKKNKDKHLGRIIEKYLECNYSGVSNNIKCYIDDYEHNKEEDTVKLIIKSDYKAGRKEFTVDYPQTWNDESELVQVIEEIGYGSLNSIKDEKVYLYAVKNGDARIKELPLKIKSDDRLWYLSCTDLSEETKVSDDENKGFLNKILSKV